ncbi:MAG: 5'-methylthioadenosine/adenosylhomocysteine nucleosidase [Fibromonadaceae bacterium]|jgi:adenosylhomocysteine nucleosidase|nr:5'-methylthioadenosine/adenosylhomocysteine nucleosidase [Fibromonadaceae bacterium]
MKTIAILTAMQQELDAVLEAFGPGATRADFCGMQIHIFEQNEIKFVLALSGVGRANTAMNAALIIREFNPNEVINVGSAGGLQEEQKILDVVIPSEIVAVDVDLTALGCEYGQVLGCPKSYFTDEKMRKKLIEVSKDLVVAHTGVIGSSEAFICREEQVREIQRRFDNRVLCVEMEAFSIAVVCSNFNIPFAVIRSLSDVPAKGEGNEHDFNAFLNCASKNAARLLWEYSSSQQVDISLKNPL